MDFTEFWNCTAEVEAAYDTHRKQVMGRFALTAVEVDVLLFIANNPGLNTAADVVRLRKISKAHVSMAVKSLSEKGYIAKNCDGRNRKLIRLCPTEDAQEAIDFARSEQIRFLQAMMRGFAEEDRECFQRYMKRIKVNIHAAYDETRKQMEE